MSLSWLSADEEKKLNEEINSRWLRWQSTYRPNGYSEDDLASEQPTGSVIVIAGAAVLLAGFIIGAMWFFAKFYPVR